MPPDTSLGCRFNSLSDQQLLSWLSEYPWTKTEIALTWLTLLKCDISSVGPPWWGDISLGSSCNNPGISWLWNIRYEVLSERQFVYFLRTFLESPKRCCHLSVGEALDTYHFAHLCVQIVLNNCLGSTDLLSSRYLLFYFFLFVEHTDDTPMQVIFIAFMKVCRAFWIITMFPVAQVTLGNASRQVKIYNIYCRD